MLLGVKTGMKKTRKLASVELQFSKKKGKVVDKNYEENELETNSDIHESRLCGDHSSSRLSLVDNTAGPYYFCLFKAKNNKIRAISAKKTNCVKV